jgi:hypothetical protein
MSDDLVALEARIEDLARTVRALQSAINPVDASGLPVPTQRTGSDITNVEGPRWQVGKNWTVIAMSEPDDEHCVFLRDYFGQSTGDINTISTRDAIQLAGALLAAARYSGDELSRTRGKAP